MDANRPRRVALMSMHLSTPLSNLRAILGAAALTLGATACSNDSTAGAVDPDARPATVVIETDTRGTLYQRSLSLRGRVEGSAYPLRLEMIVDSGTASERTVVGERGQYMTFPSGI